MLTVICPTCGNVWDSTRVTQALQSNECVMRVGAAHQDHKLFTTKPVQLVMEPEIAPHQTRQQQQHFVTDQVPEVVVDPLEVVNIQHRQPVAWRIARGPALRLHQFGLGMPDLRRLEEGAIKRLAIQQFGQRILLTIVQQTQKVAVVLNRTVQRISKSAEKGLLAETSSSRPTSPRVCSMGNTTRQGCDFDTVSVLVVAAWRRSASSTSAATRTSLPTPDSARLQTPQALCGQRQAAPVVVLAHDAHQLNGLHAFIRMLTHQLHQGLIQRITVAQAAHAHQSIDQSFHAGIRLPEIRRAQSDYQGVAVPTWRQWLNRGGLVDNPRIVQQQYRPGFGQRKALAIGAIGIKHTGLAPFDVVAIHQENRHQVHPVTVCTFGRGTANAVGGINAELVGLGVPGLCRL